MKYVVMVKIKIASESKPYWSGWEEEEAITPEAAALKARKMYGEMLEKLDSWGVVMPRAEDGGYRVIPTGPFTAMICIDLDITLKVRRRAEKLGVRFMDKTVFSDLLTEGNTVTVKRTKLVEKNVTLGRLIFNEAIPQGIGFNKKRVDAFDLEVYDVVKKKQLGQIIDKCLKVHGTATTAQVLDKVKALGYKYSTRYLAIKYLENDKEIDKVVEALPNRDEIIAARFEEHKRIESLLKSGLESALVDAKYAFVQGALAETYEPYKGKKRRNTLTDKLDAVITNKWLAFPIFFFLLYVVFQSTFLFGEYPMQWIEWLVEQVGAFVASTMNDGWLKDLVVDGIIGGVGSVLVFLPNILILYLFISLLEDSGYMARAAFIMDKLMHKIGLHGKSFIPMVMGFGCNVPAITATRTIESYRSRLITMLILPLMSCSARLPVYIMIIGTFFAVKYQSLIMISLYAIGILLSIIVSRILSSFLIKGEDTPFVMELPPYRLPTAKATFRHTWEKGKQYLQKMSGIILICSMAIWFLGYFPNHDAYSTVQEQQEHSFIGYVGKAMEPVLEPLGFDWKMGVGIVAGVGAKELVVSTLGVMYADEAPTLQDALVQTVPPAGALAYMVFILLYFPCIATFVAIKNESGGWKWAIITAVYTIVLAWVAAFITFQVASLFI